jgi:hypothetical protein
MEPIAMPRISSFLLLALSCLPAVPAAAGEPDAIAAPGETAVATVQAAGAQIYDCKAGAAGGLSWTFREPIATLISDGRTVGRHYAGPTWEMADGSAVAAKVVGRASATTADDIPWLKLEVTSRRGSGQLSAVTTIQRINTKGGVAVGACEAAGAVLAVPYTADYALLRRERLTLGGTRHDDALPPIE